MSMFSEHHASISSYDDSIIITLWPSYDQIIILSYGRVYFVLLRKQFTWHFLAPATFWWIQPIVPGFVRIIIRFAWILGRSAEFAQKWLVNFQLSNGSKIAMMAPISTIFGRNRSRRPKLFFPKFSRGRKKFSRRRKNFATHERSNERGARKCQVNALVES